MSKISENSCVLIMKKASKEEKEQRFLYMKEMSGLVINFAVAETMRDFGPDLAEDVRNCLSLNEDRLYNAISYYYDKLLYDYKEKMDILMRGKSVIPVVTKWLV